MPDFDTYDIDAAFRDLEQDIAGISAPRGAGSAVSTARHRRRRAIGGAVAGLAIVVGAVAVGQGVASRGHTVGPAALPAPATFDAAALSAATDGWAEGWHSPTKADESSLDSASSPGCLDSLDIGDTIPDPARSGSLLVVSQDAGTAALGSLLEWNDQHPDTAASGYAAVVEGIDECAKATSGKQYAWDGGRARSWDVGHSGADSQHLWVAQTGRAVAILWSGGSAGPVPAAVDERVAVALVAGLQAPGSFKTNDGLTTSGSSTSTSSGVSTQTITDDAFARAVSDWDPRWRGEGSDQQAISNVPCDTGWTDAAPGSSGGSLGNGDQEYATFSSPHDAQAALTTIQTSFATCSGSAYDVSRIDSGHVTTVVATGRTTMWAVAFKDMVGVVVIPHSGGPTPPAQVTTDVTGLILAAMTGGPSSTPSGK